MQQISFYSYKLADKINLKRISNYFIQTDFVGWKDYILVDGENLSTILKYESMDKKVYIFKFGCVVFVDFLQDEIFSFLGYFESIIGEIDHNKLYKYNENHILRLYDDGNCCLSANSDTNVPYFSYIDDILAAVLVKSTELYKIEVELSELLDSAEEYIKFLETGKFKASTKKAISTLVSIIAFKFKTLESVKIHDTPTDADKSILSRQVYNELSAHYELEERYSIINNQMENLHSITESYFKIGNKQIQKRLLWLEVFLLGLFPVFHLIEKFFGIDGLLSVFKI